MGFSSITSAIAHVTATTPAGNRLSNKETGKKYRSVMSFYVQNSFFALKSGDKFVWKPPTPFIIYSRPIFSIIASVPAPQVPTILISRDLPFSRSAPG